jgi:tetratricopeptide (TPR) repeat protein
MLKAFEAADNGDFEGAIEFCDSILRLDVAPDQEVRARIFKSFYLLQVGEFEKSALETELAMILDRSEKTREFEETSNRSMVLGNLDYQWLERMKAFGRAGKSAAGINFGIEKLRLVDAVPGTYMPLTRFWLGRHMAALGDTDAALEMLRSGLAAEVYEEEAYAQVYQEWASSAGKALEMYTGYRALSPQQAFESGTEAMMAGDDAMAIRAFRDALELQMAAVPAIHAHLRLALLYSKQGKKDKLIEHGEEALRLDANQAVSILADHDDEFRDVLFAKLEANWGRSALQLEQQNSIQSALNYLADRIELVSYLPDDFFPLLRLTIGKYSLQVGDFDTAGKHLVNAVASQFPTSDNAELVDLTQQVKTEAGNWLLHLTHKRRTGVSRGILPSKDELASEKRCWLASASCGTHSVEVALLRRFRDTYLTHGWKRTMVAFYYRTAPGIAEVIERQPFLMTLVRVAIVAPTYRFAIRCFRRSIRRV